MHANIWGGDLMGKPKPKMEKAENLTAHNQQQMQQFTGVVDSIHAKMQKSENKKQDFNFAELLGDIKFINDKKKDKSTKQNEQLPKTIIKANSNTDDLS